MRVLMVFSGNGVIKMCCAHRHGRSGGFTIEIVKHNYAYLWMLIEWMQMLKKFKCILGRLINRRKLLSKTQYFGVGENIKLNEKHVNSRDDVTSVWDRNFKAGKWKNVNIESITSVCYEHDILKSHISSWINVFLLARQPVALDRHSHPNSHPGFSVNSGDN